MKGNKLLVSALVVLGFTASSSSYADISCFPASLFIETKKDSEILAKLNELPTYSEKISKRKTFYLYGANSVSSSGCTIEAEFDVKVARKLRKDAKGTLKMRTEIDRFTGCLKDSAVVKFDLSNLLNVGEAFYRRAANKRIPDTICL